MKDLADLKIKQSNFEDLEDLEDLEIKQSRFGKLEDWKIFESCKLRKLNILKVEKLKFGKFKLKAGKWKDELDSWVKF